MPNGLLGIENLISKLKDLMYKHIRAFLPEIMLEISSKLKECKDRLNDLGPNVPTSDVEKS